MKNQNIIFIYGDTTERQCMLNEYTSLGSNREYSIASEKYIVYLLYTYYSDGFVFFFKYFHTFI